MMLSTLQPTEISSTMAYSNPNSTLTALLLPLLLLVQYYCFLSSSSSEAVYDITDFGAKPDGKSDSASAVTAAWAKACSTAGLSALHVPSGSFYLGPVKLQGPCNSSWNDIRIDGTLIAPSDYNQYNNVPWIWLAKVDNATIFGGTIDGSGKELWDCKTKGGNCPQGANSLVVDYSSNIYINGLTAINSEFYHIVITHSQGVTVQGGLLTAPGDSLNTDGIHIGSSSNVNITGTQIETGDDCISIGPGTTNVWIEQVHCGPGHGISIGSMGGQPNEEGVQNIVVTNTNFKETLNGFRIKTWAKPSNSFIKDVVFQHAEFQNVNNPILIDQYYCPHNQCSVGQDSGIKISNVTLNDVHGSSATQVAVKFNCSSIQPCTEIQLNDINLTYPNGPIQSSCTNANGRASGVENPANCLR